MEPHIQYAKTSDGVNIAFWTLGEGPALVQTPAMPLGEVQLGLLPDERIWPQHLPRARQLIRYDARGTGLSDRNVHDFSLDALVLDLEAVVARLRLETFALWGFLTSGPVAIAYAARHPEQVTHLILWSSWARPADILSLPQAQGLLALIDKDWELFTETATHMLFGWSAGELAHRAAALLRETTTPELARALIEALTQFDVTNLLPQVRCPALVLHPGATPLPDVSAARELAARMPDARLLVLRGMAELSDAEGRAIAEFLGDVHEEPAGARPSAPGDLVTILFTDLASSTALTQRLGDANAQELLRAHNAIVREALRAHGGSEIKHTGDGIMASFTTASSALACAVAIQRGVALRQAQGGGMESLAVHIGLNAGEPVVEEQDLFGTAVQLARRICDHAQGGQILASNVVRELAAGKRFLFSDVGEVAPKGFDEAVRLYEVRWRE